MITKVASLPDPSRPTEKPERVRRSTTCTTSTWMEEGRVVREGGLHWIITGLFLVGDLAGGGLVAMPTATMRLGLIPGLIIQIFMLLTFAATSYLLGKCWNAIQRQWPEYMDHCRNPYPEIGYRAFGTWCKNLVSICIDVTQFGIAVVFLLLSSKNIHDFLLSFLQIEINFCLVIIIVAVCLLPITFLKSPQDFWGAVVVGMFTTTAAVILIIVGASHDHSACSYEKAYPEKHLSGYFVALGAFLFAYGGHSAFPTIQHDMHRPSEFTNSTFLAFTIVGAMYIPVCIVTYFTYGDSIQDSVINSLQQPVIQQAVNLLITVHCILTLTIVFNPLNQEMEEFVGVAHSFGIGRMLVRTGVMSLVVFVAESVPRFGPLLELVGGSTMGLTALFFPPLFFLKLNAMWERNKSKAVDGAGNDKVTFAEIIQWNSKPAIVGCIIIILFAVIGGGSATYSAMVRIFDTSFVPPCYVTYFSGHMKVEGVEATNCCGHFQNITTIPDLVCARPNLDFYS